MLPLLAAPVQKSYNSYLNARLLPDFGYLRLHELTRPKLQLYFTTLKAKRAILTKIRDTLASVLNAAVQFGFLTKTPLEGVRVPNREGKSKKPTITYQEFEDLVNSMQEPYGTMVNTCVLAALRVSELVALKDIGPDFVMVDERFCRGDWSKPKIESSCAPVAVDREVLERIYALKDKSTSLNWGGRGAKRTFKVVRSDGPSDLTFQSPKTGGPMSDGNVLPRHIKPAAKALGLGRVNWQVLRRSLATWMVVKVKTDPKSAQAQMRHASLKPTLEIYAQQITEAQRQAVRDLKADMDRSRRQSVTPKSAPTGNQLEHFGT